MEICIVELASPTFRDTATCIDVEAVANRLQCCWSARDFNSRAPYTREARYHWKFEVVSKMIGSSRGGRTPRGSCLAISAHLSRERRGSHHNVDGATLPSPLSHVPCRLAPTIAKIRHTRYSLW